MILADTVSFISLLSLFFPSRVVVYGIKNLTDANTKDPTKGITDTTYLIFIQITLFILDAWAITTSFSLLNSSDAYYCKALPFCLTATNTTSLSLWMETSSEVMLWSVHRRSWGGIQISWWLLWSRAWTLWIMCRRSWRRMISLWRLLKKYRELMMAAVQKRTKIIYSCGV